MDLHPTASRAPVCDAERPPSGAFELPAASALELPAASAAQFAHPDADVRIAARAREEKALDALEARITRLWGDINAATAAVSGPAGGVRPKGRLGPARHGELRPVAELAMRHRRGGGEREGAHGAGPGIAAEDRTRLRRGPAVVFEGTRPHAGGDSGDGRGPCCTLP